ncbi:hypothetical protein RHMOL_Rhmol01G0086700 [Rhododendron molle]|uniref:Uncharacterized protein n=1 Tax=Rhododendron molle TaxID=49168 RepID=A0ACC0PZN4_RHOML|nr:hypothetical protein RHMOL_Rhmol01G0086700 [Rhododendron molle]
MVELNQVRSLKDSSELLNLEASNVGNLVDFSPVIPKTPLPEFLETSTSQKIDKSAYAPTEISPPLVNTSILDTNEPSTLVEISALETHSSEATAHMVLEKAMPSEVKAFCDKICLPVQPPIVLCLMDELTALLDPPCSCLKSTFSTMVVQELIEIHQGFYTLDFSSLIEHQLWD